MDIGLKIKELTASKNISVPLLAQKLGKSEQAIYAIFNKSDVNTSILKKLSIILDTPITSFFEESGNKTQKVDGYYNILVDHHNNGNISVSDHKEQLDNIKREVEHLKEVIESKNQIIEEKERLINVLMNK